MNPRDIYVKPVDPGEYNWACFILSMFFSRMGFTKAALQHLLAILSACENVDNITTFPYMGELWPMVQTNQMKLENLLLTCQKPVKGYHCETVSYREEPAPKRGRHDFIFFMWEFELRYGFKALLALLKKLVIFLGFTKGPVPVVDYRTFAKKCGVEELTDEHEMQIWKEYGPVALLVDFPMVTNPFFNMKLEGENGDKVAKKCDVIICGMETIGSAERSCDPFQMRKAFHTISGGRYAGKLQASFGRDRVQKELDDFLELPMFPRSGGGIGMTRLLRGARELGLIKPIEKVEIPEIPTLDPEDEATLAD